VDQSYPYHSWRSLANHQPSWPGIDDEEFYRLVAGEVIDDAKLFNAKLHEWERFYNFARPHGALGGLTPYERLRQLTMPWV